MLTMKGNHSLWGFWFSLEQQTRQIAVGQLKSQRKGDGGQINDHRKPAADDALKEQLQIITKQH